MKFNKFKKSTRFLAITIALLTLALSFPLTAFAADNVEPRYTIIHTPDGGTISTDPAVKKVDEIPNYLFEDPLGSSRAMMEGRSTRAAQEIKGSYTVEEYGDLWIQKPTEAVGTVTWSVSNSFLASVDSSGMVYVNTAGAFFVLADFVDASGNARTFRYDILIELPNGVYKFKNKANNYNIVLPDSNISIGTYYKLANDTSARNSEFKITDVGTGLYTIRSMVASHVGMSALITSSTDYLVNSVVETGPLADPNNEAYIDNADLWGIASTASGYYFYNISAGTGVYTITPVSNTASSNFKLDYFAGSANQFWTLTSVIANQHGVEIRNSTDALAVGDTFQFTATMYSSYSNAHGQHGIVWSISSGSSYASINSYTGVLTANSIGSVTVTASYVYNSNVIWSDDYELYIIPLAEGVYIFANKETEKYMKMNGSEVVQHEYVSDNTKQWKIEHEEDGYYKIKNPTSSYYLTAPSSNTENEAVWVQSFLVSMKDRQLWNFTKISNGVYTISSKSGNMTIAVEDVVIGQSNNNLEIVQVNYDGSDSTYLDEWIAYSCQDNVVNLEVVYDGGYSERHTDVVSRITEEMADLQEKYLTDFGLWINYSYPTRFTSYADLCSSDYDELCEEGTGCAYHHKNFYNVFYDIVMPDTSETLKVAYVGHDTCWVNPDTQEHEKNEKIVGFTITSYGLAMVMNHGGSSSETRTLVHEFGHLLGAPDHYNNNCPSTSDLNEQYNTTTFSQQCIYGENKDDISDLRICMGCSQRIASNVGIYNH